MVELVVLVVSMEWLCGFEDIFSSFFGGGGGMRNPNAPRQGDDLQYRATRYSKLSLVLKKKRLQP